MSVIPTGIIPAQGISFEAEAYDPALLNAIIVPWRPDVRIDKVRLVESKRYGDGMVSTAARAFLDVGYTPGSPAGLPTSLVLKLGRSADFTSSRSIRTKSASMKSVSIMRSGPN